MQDHFSNILNHIYQQKFYFQKFHYLCPILFDFILFLKNFKIFLLFTITVHRYCLSYCSLITVDYLSCNTIIVLQYNLQPQVLSFFNPNLLLQYNATLAIQFSPHAAIQSSHLLQYTFTSLAASKSQYNPHLHQSSLQYNP